MNITPITNKPGCYLVPSSDGRRHYEVTANGPCECSDYVYRRAESYDLCRHGVALRAYLACPACGGRGHLVPQFRYASGSEPLPCVVCDGTGQREGADPGLVALADRCRAEQRDRHLQEMAR